MPRYHFHSTDGTRDFDGEGLVLPDDAAAQHMATAFAGEVLKNEPDVIWDRGPFRVEVTDGAGLLLWTVVTLAVIPPQPKPLLLSD